MSLSNLPRFIQKINGELGLELRSLFPESMPFAPTWHHLPRIPFPSAYVSIHLSIYSPSIYSSICLPFLPPIHSPSCSHSSTHQCTHPPIYPSTHISITHLPTYSSIHLPIHSTANSSIHPSTPPSFSYLPRPCRAGADSTPFWVDKSASLVLSLP